MRSRGVLARAAAAAPGLPAQHRVSSHARSQRPESACPQGKRVRECPEQLFRGGHKPGPPDALQSVGERLGSGPHPPTVLGVRRDGPPRAGLVSGTLRHSQKAAALELHLAQCSR